MPVLTPAPLLVLAPIDPRPTGNGLAMRVARIVEAARSVHDVQVAVVPVAGSVPGPAPRPPVPVQVVAPPGGPALRAAMAELVTDPRWRARLAAAGPLPALARAAPPALAPAVVGTTRARPGTAVLAVRSYLAPLGLAVADRLGSPWAALDLDDDDEALAALDDPALAASYHRLVATFAPLYGAVSLAAPADAESLGGRHGLRPHTVVNAVDVPSSVRVGQPTTGTVVFVGNLSYPPNATAARVLAEQVLPALQARRSQPVLVELAGAYHPEGPVARLVGIPGVRVHGYVEDLGALYARAGVVVAPIPAGSGTRIKLLEAFAAGVPVVTTPAGAAGLAARPGEHFLVGSSSEELAAAASAVLGDTALAARLAAAAFVLVSSVHSPSVATRQVCGLLAAAACHEAER